jgi:AMMECR1 domain-containing protein
VEPSSVDGALTRPLLPRERDAVRRDVRGWLHFQETLRGFRPQRSRVDATAFVALYANGTLRGCVGSTEGGADQALARAFLSAAHDARFGGVREADRRDLAAEVTFMRAPRLVGEASVSEELELGTHGLGLLRPGSFPVFLLPDVARDSRLDAAGMLEALRRKAGPDAQAGALFMFEAESVVVRRDDEAVTPGSPVDAAALWLASLVRRHGAVSFAVDARTGAVTDVGRMHHGRAASVLHALAAHGGHRALVARGRARLADEVRAALAGRVVDGWPETAPEVAGTLALAVRAGVPLRAELEAFVRERAEEVMRVPWHAAQVVAALGPAAPLALWDACLADLAKQPWAPWTVLAGHARGAPLDRVASAVAGLVDAIRVSPPYAGAVFVTRVAEVAITALTVEGLLAYPDAPGAKDAIRRARAFLAGQQLLGAAIPAGLSPTASEGAFVAAPASTLLRGDVTAHALMALRSHR